MSSRFEDILLSIIAQEPYDERAMSRAEFLLKYIAEHGTGGGGNVENFIQILAKGEQPTEALQDGGIVFENIFEEV